jgi:tetratricopeptide (TPR) repeat protein
MGSNTLRLFCITVLAAVFSGAASHDNFKQEMRFGAEAAQRGLWREAAFRWEKILKADPDNAHVHNNLAVASESLGQFDRARREYEEAHRLAPDSKEIRNNYESFLELCRSIKVCGGEPAATPSPSPVPEGGGPVPPPANEGGTPVPSPSPDGA